MHAMRPKTTNRRYATRDFFLHRYKNAMMKLLMLVVFGLTLLPGNEAVTATYGVCQSGCAKAATACYREAGFVFGTVKTGVGTPPAVLSCNAAFGQCSSACAAMAPARTGL